MRFRLHYTREQARALLPQVGEWLRQLQSCAQELARLEVRLGSLMQGGRDIGGATLNEWVRLFARMRALHREFEVREIQIKDVDRGLVDFPAIVQGREVFLCWELGEEDVEFWHELDGGYAGREHL